MPEQITPSEKTLRMPVKLVSTDGVELPLKGFVLIPEERLVLLEKLAVTARNLVSSHGKATLDLQEAQKAGEAVTVLGDWVGELEKIWDIPQGKTVAPKGITPGATAAVPAP